jgi:hypothetical protein
MKMEAVTPSPVRCYDYGWQDTPSCLNFHIHWSCSHCDAPKSLFSFALPPREQRIARAQEERVVVISACRIGTKIRRLWFSFVSCLHCDGSVRSHTRSPEADQDDHTASRVV